MLKCLCSVSYQCESLLSIKFSSPILSSRRQHQCLITVNKNHSALIVTEVDVSLTTVRESIFNDKKPTIPSSKSAESACLKVGVASVWIRLGRSLESNTAVIVA